MSEKGKEILKALLGVLIIVILGISLAYVIYEGSHKKQEPSDSSEKTTISTNLVITFDKETNKEEIKDTVELKQGATVVDQYVETDKAEFDDELGYVTGINDVNSKGMCGWVYEINDKPVTTGADQTVLQDKDTVHWFWSCYEG